MSADRILIVEDELVVAEDLRSDLSLHGYDVLGVAHSAKQALTMAEAAKPDLVLMDIVLEGDGDGIEAAKHLGDEKSIPVVFLTAYSDSETLARVKETSPFGYIVKPYNSRAVVATIDVALNEHRVRMKAERQLQKLSKVVEQTADYVLITDKAGTIEYVNEALVAGTGYDRSELIGKTPQVFKSGKYGNAFYQKMWQTILAGKPYHNILVNRKKNGELYTEEKTITPLKDQDGRINSFVSTAKDVTRRIESERRLAIASRLETIGTLAGGIAHDFNNILTPIMGYADMALSDLPSSNPLRDDLEHILLGARRAKDLVEQILLFSRQVEKKRQPLSLHLIVKEALKLLRPSIPSTIEIRKRIDVSCDKILADASQMHQIIVNLCTNAWHAMAEKRGVLTIELAQVEVDAATAKLHINLKAGEYVRLSVVDTGAGMDEATLERIFEPFFTTKSVDKGTGMGLAVVHGIVHNHHGEIIVDSVPGKGSTFHVYLPTIKVEVEPDKKEWEATAGGQESILVVDDDDTVAKVIKRMLEHLGYKVDVYTSGIEALKAFRQQADRYDLVISDLTMPDMTALELSEQLRKVSSQLPIIVMTGYRGSMTQATQKTFGINNIIGKPVAMRELASAIRIVLDK